ncbi:NAD(P)H-dependent glycerol-3-phosphate dehydrogenase [Alkalinema sp. FACHB-956]|uniref:NAD(P)H-dependent glycerol-3-phosphate dehydrogenase n=1 Tax=Alkalinema sp. FACHB-956 TaxID=2692768 RepID=UPI001682B5D2|nr:NAD(P)H-dependent glycerol-3-phosphate dehydrogenase [Alkalinema sp. FACHB-956]MBD2326575.1 NAD(P)H-dependent glycerol-3-phosphate dehydrogenase [Alkalinema sp. FACHB-956]
MKITIVGAGAWGTTLATLARENGHEVILWSRSSATSLQAAIAGSQAIVSAISMKGVRSIVQQLQTIGLGTETILVSATKGLDPNSGTATALPKLPSQLWQAAFPDNPVVVLSGPNLSKEIQQGLPAATVVASDRPAAATQVQTLFSSPRFRVYTNDDPLGVELGGALKNVMAIAVGTCDGLNLGTNAKSGLITRGLAEMIRIGVHWGAKADTFYGLSGMGDLMATCSSVLSRNYQVGYGLAQGQTLTEILAHLEGTAEGVNTTQVLLQVAQHQGIELPIAEQVYGLIQGQITPQEAIAALMSRVSKPER